MNFDLLFEKAKQAGITDLEIYAEKKKGLEISVFAGKVEKNVMSRTNGLAIRGIYKGQMGYVSVENTTDNSIDFIINSLKENASLLTNQESSSIFAGSESYVEPRAVDASVTKVSPKIKIDLLLRLESQLKSLDSRVSSVDAEYMEEVVETSILNSKGLNLTKTEMMIIVFAAVVVKEGEDVKNYGDYFIVKSLEELDVDAIATDLVSKAVSQLNASPVKSKKYPVVLENKVFASLLSAFVPMFSGESAIKNVTPLKDKVGDVIGGQNINLINDPFFQGAFSQSSFDDEGVACQTTEVMTNGKLNTLLHNLKTAQQCKTNSTGNGFKSGLKAPVGIEPYNLYLKPGQAHFDEMVQSMEEGLLITSVQGLHAGVNTITGDFSLQASGYLIENKSIKRPVTLIVISGNILDLFNEVELIGNDLKFTYSRVGAPTIKIKQCSVSGL
jgi:PmbA protein